MNITVSVFGRFHAFYLAHQLQKHGHLQRLITSYPKFEVRKYGITDSKTCSLLTYELVRRGLTRVPSWIKPDMDLRFWLSERFDHAACSHIPKGTELFIGWSSFSEEGLLRARGLGAVTILERGSSHIEYQRDILHQEYSKYGLEACLPHPQIVEKEKREYAIADYIEVPSTFAYQSFVEKGIDEKKLIRGFRGVDLSNFHKLPKQDNVFRVVFAGAMVLRKGVHYLLQAFVELNLPNSELWLLGGKKPEIESFFRKYDGYFRYFGAVPQAKLHEYYSQCSVFVICSIEEGLAMVQPQAMACGLPLICTTNTGGEDLIEDGKEGFIVPIRDVDALKERILRLYDQKDLCHKMGQAAYRKVRSGLTWDDYGDFIVQQHQDIISKRGGNN
jgi:glycosyltransferase involved in cell wall biosynthesis